MASTFRLLLLVAAAAVVSFIFFIHSQLSSFPSSSAAAAQDSEQSQNVSAMTTEAPRCSPTQRLLPSPWREGSPLDKAGCASGGPCATACQGPTVWRRCEQNFTARTQQQLRLDRQHFAADTPPPTCYQKRDTALKLGLITFATGGYLGLLDEFAARTGRFFFPQDNVTLFVFTDGSAKALDVGQHRVSWNFAKQAHWPHSSDQRFGVIARNLLLFEGLDYLYSLDIDLHFQHFVCDEYLGELVALRHPLKQCDWVQAPDAMPVERRNISTAYIPYGENEMYFMGSQFGGRTARVLQLADECTRNQDIDAANGIQAVVDDESHLNRYFVSHPPEVILSASYCVPQPFEHFRNWVGDFEPIIYHVAKPGSWRS